MLCLEEDGRWAGTDRERDSLSIDYNEWIKPPEISILRLDDDFCRMDFYRMEGLQKTEGDVLAWFLPLGKWQSKTTKILELLLYLFV